MNINILAIKYPSAIDVSQQRKVDPVKYAVEAKNVEATIKDLLFGKKYSYVLICINNKLYICESIDEKTKLYSRREIGYHPFSELVMNK